MPQSSTLKAVRRAQFVLTEKAHFITGYITPGFIDVHAHWNGFADFFAASSWELETFLAYGVTTLHKYALP